MVHPLGRLDHPGQALGQRSHDLGRLPLPQLAPVPGAVLAIDVDDRDLLTGLPRDDGELCRERALTGTTLLRNQGPDPHLTSSLQVGYCGHISSYRGYYSI